MKIDTGSLDHRLASLAAARWRIAMALTAAMVVLYFGFILLVAYAPGALGRQLVPGVSIGILLGASVIVISWLLTWVYVRWANAHYDVGMDSLRDEGKA